MKQKYLKTIIAVASLATFAANAANLTVDEREWVEQYKVVKAVGDVLHQQVKIRVIRSADVNVSPAVADYNKETDTCTLIVSPEANTTAKQLLDNVSETVRADRILAILAHEFGHCVAYRTGFTKVGAEIVAKDEAYGDVFSVTFMSITRPESYKNVMRMWRELRSDREVAADRYTSNWIKYSEQIWNSKQEPDAIAAEYAIK